MARALAIFLYSDGLQLAKLFLFVVEWIVCRMNFTQLCMLQPRCFGNKGFLRKITRDLTVEKKLVYSDIINTLFTCYW